jgi:hypothetical protein
MFTIATHANIPIMSREQSAVPEKKDAPAD